MNIILPITISSTNFRASSILENEYSEWEAGGFVAVNASPNGFIALCRASSGNMYAASGAGIYKSTDNGVNWALIGGSPTGVYGLCALGTNIYACDAGTKKIYMDTGESGIFSDLGAAVKSWMGMCVSTAGDVFCVSTDGGVYKQTGGTGAFAQVNATVRSYYACCGAYDGSIYFCVNAGSIYRSADGGTTLTDLVQTARNWRSMTADSNGHIYAGCYGGDIYKRTNGAGNFTAIGGTDLSWWGMAYDSATDTLYGSVSGGYVYSCTGTTIYSDGNTVQVTSGTNLADHKIYESLTNNNASNNPTTDTTNWLLIGNTNRTKGYDSSIASQSSASESITNIYAPGAIGAISILNHESSTISIIEIKNEDALINTTAWAGATGTTQPTGWDKVGTPSDFTIDSGALKMTVDANGEGISKTVAVTAATEYQLLFFYKNTAGDIAQVAIYDESNSSNILAVLDLPSVTAGYTPYSHVFTTPEGCISLTVKLLAKTSGDIVYFDYCKFAPTIYSETITTGALVTYSAKTDLVSEANCILTVTITNTGSTAKVGEIVMGPKYDIGGRGADYGISWGVKDWSTIEADTYGHYDIVTREKSKWMKCSIDVPIADVDYVSNLMSYYMSTYLMWLGSLTNQAQMIYGFADDWSFSQDEPSFAKLSISITGIT